LKLVTFKVHTQERIGAILEDMIVDLNSAHTLMLSRKGKQNPRRHSDALIPGSMLDFLKCGDESIDAARKAFAFAGKNRYAIGIDEEKIVLSKIEAKLLAPIPRPGNIYCVAVNFYDHATEDITDPEQRQKEVERLKSLKLGVPLIFQKPSSIVIGPRDALIKVKATDYMDYECELAVIIGKKGVYVSKEEAYDYIAGYTILIDISARDQGFPEDVDFRIFKGNINWTKGKGMDNAAPLGPCIITKDEVPDPYNPPLRLQTRVNGMTRQNNTLDHMIIKIPRIIEYLSNGTTLNPGDIISTGTVAGVARSWGSEGFLKVGDTIECEIQPIGILEHKVVSDPWK
jgi:acylpyruvate hydrolase